VNHPVTEQVVRIYLAEAFSDGFGSADVLLLGCTHYPLLKPLLQRVVPQVQLVDSAESTALTVRTLIGAAQKPAPVKPKESRQPQAELSFFVTDSTQKFTRLGALFLGRSIERITHVDLKE
jgi:glutamate racemase